MKNGKLKAYAPQPMFQNFYICARE